MHLLDLLQLHPKASYLLLHDSGRYLCNGCQLIGYIQGQVFNDSIDGEMGSLRASEFFQMDAFLEVVSKGRVVEELIDEFVVDKSWQCLHSIGLLFYQSSFLLQKSKPQKHAGKWQRQICLRQILISTIISLSKQVYIAIVIHSLQLNSQKFLFLSLNSIKNHSSLSQFLTNIACQYWVPVINLKSFMKLKKFLLRYYPPGILLEYIRNNGEVQTKSIDLLNLSSQTDVDELVEEIAAEEPIITESKKPQLKTLIERLIMKLEEKKNQNFTSFKTLKAHVLPLTNCSFNKNGDKFITGSYDRTCQIWDTETGNLIHKLQGHKNAVYALAFNVPFGDKIVTGSFDTTAKLWDTDSGKLLYTFAGHQNEVVAVAFDPHKSLCATGSMDQTAKLWDLETGKEHSTLKGHEGQIVSLNFNADGDKILTGSFDGTAIIWDTKSGEPIHVLQGHTGQISSAQFQFGGYMCGTASIDKTCRIWDVGSGKCMSVLRGHTDQILDFNFNAIGTSLVTASVDMTMRVYNVSTFACTSVLEGHEGEVSKAVFNPQGTKILSASFDHTARLWDAESGKMLQTLEGHEDEIFSCQFNYEGDTIITGSKDNTCRIWRDTESFKKPKGKK